MTNNIINALSWIHAFYKKWISPLFGDVCRFDPPCSDYSLEAIKRYGLLKGTFLAFRRLLRCNSLSKGGSDPVP